jgi:acetylornithine/succinyldiaminopimelate/putrescine aminotransferase/acyl-CoA synthetase (AMP-forming)/AMP-acid ligase II/predicted amino acid dehydrogenase/acyl carrier protein
MTGERALLLYPPGLEFIAAFFGCLYAGVIVVPAYPPQRGRAKIRIEAIAADAQPRVIIAPASIQDTFATCSGHAPQLRALQFVSVLEDTTGLEYTWRHPLVTRSHLAFLQYTSGSTGDPKGVMVSHGNLLHNAALMAYALEGTPYGAEMSPYQLEATRYSDMVSWLPPYHDMGLIGGILMPLYGAKPATLMAPETFLQRPYRWLQAITHYRATYSAAPNFAYDLCVRKIAPEQRQTLDLSCWRRALCGAEPVRAQTLERFAAAFAACGFRQEAFYPTYGLAEATLMASGNRHVAAPVLATVKRTALAHHQVVMTRAEDEQRHQLVGCGQTLLGQHILIVHPETLTKCAAHEVGEIWISGGSIAQGYWQRPEESEQTFQARLADTGEGPFLRTGDLGFLHDGHLFITGRLKELIIIHGTNYYPQDIELTVQQSHPILRPHAGVAFSIEVNAEEQLVIVQEVERPNALNVDAVVAAIRQAVADRHGVQAYTVVLVRPGSVLKTSSGKLQRHATRAAYEVGTLQVVGMWQRESPEETSSHIWRPQAAIRSTAALEAWLIVQLASRLKIDARSIDTHTPIVHYGLDSIAALEMMSEIEEVFHVAVQVENVFVGSLSIADISKKLSERLEDDFHTTIEPSPKESSQHFHNDSSSNGAMKGEKGHKYNKLTQKAVKNTWERSGRNFQDFVNPYLGSLLAALNLDKQFTRGQGCYLYDQQGNRYLDFIAQYGALPFGFNYPAIWRAVEAVRDTQEPSFVQPSFLEAAGEVASRLIAVSPAGLQYVTFANSGAEAIEAAIKLSRAATGRLGILSTHNSFHGKTLGALSVTGNPKYQHVFGAPIAEFRSIPFGDIEALEQALAQAPDSYAAFVVEPIQGEGGIVEAPAGYLGQAHALCKQAGTLLVVDEVQSGLGRTGAMFACQTEGVTPDIMTIAKALGGGLVPIGACLCIEEVYTEEFALKHSSTFAGNTLACRVALATLDLLEADDCALIRHVATQGAHLKDELLRLKHQYPHLIRAIRGRGYMLGLQFGVDRHTWGSSLLGYIAEQDFLTLLVSSYMLNVTGVRTAPTLNGSDVLRIEPPLIATWEHCQLFLEALQYTLDVLDKGNTAYFTGHLIGFESPQAVPAPSKQAHERRTASRHAQEGRFAFLLHPLHEGSYAEVDASLCQLSNKHIQRLKTRLLDHLDPILIGETTIVSPTGQMAYGEFIVVPRHADELLCMSSAQVTAEITFAANIAREHGAKILGLGGFLSVATRGGLTLKQQGLLPLTTGNSYTVVAAKEALLRVCQQWHVDLAQQSVAIVGATGAIGRAISVLLAEEISQLILIGNANHPAQSEHRLHAVAGDIIHYLWNQHRQNNANTSETLSSRIHALCELLPARPSQADFLALAKEEQQCDGAIVLTTDIDHWLPQADIVITATSSVDRLVTSQRLKRQSIVCDLSRPSNVSPDLKDTRPDVLVLEGGVVQVPGQPDFGFHFGLERGLVYACMAETMILALEKHYHNTSLGIDLDMQTVVDMQMLGGKHGFRAAVAECLPSFIAH